MSKTATIEVSAISKRQTLISIFIIGLLFFIFGFVSWLNAILIPYFKIACEADQF
jgi:fucose permease